MRRGPAVEATLALGLGLLLAVLMRRPQDVATTVPGDARDPVLLSWVLAWPAHALTSRDALWDGNAFAPLPKSLAFTDALLDYLPFGLVGEGPAAALIRYNVVLLCATALAFAGTWVLVRQLGLGRTPALVAATAWAFSPGGSRSSTTCRSCRAAASRWRWRCSPAATGCGKAWAALRPDRGGRSPAG